MKLTVLSGSFQVLKSIIILRVRLTHSATNCLTLSLHIIGGQVQLCQLGIGEAVHLPTGHVDPVRGIIESHTTHIRTEAHIKLNPLSPILSSQPDSLKTVLRSIKTCSRWATIHPGMTR